MPGPFSPTPMHPQLGPLVISQIFGSENRSNGVSIRDPFFQKEFPLAFVISTGHGLRVDSGH